MASVDENNGTAPEQKEINVPEEQIADQLSENKESGCKSAEYSYTERGLFTSEIFKVEVRNLPFFGIAELKKLLLKNFGLEVCKIKSPKRREFAYLCFRSQEDVDKAIKGLTGFQWKRHTLKASVAAASPDPLQKRRREEGGKNEVDAKRPKTVAEATCPLYAMPYEDQLKKKSQEMENILEEFGKKLYKINPDAKSKLPGADTKFPCEFLGVKASPKIDGYRNKSEFAIGKNAQGDIVVGFRLGSYVDGCVEVGPIQDLPHIPEKMKKAAKVFEEFVGKSKFQVYKPENHSGHFKQLGVRTSEASDEIMLIVGIYSTNCSESELVELKAELKEFFEKYDKLAFECTSLYYQDMQLRKPGQMVNPVEHLSGTTHIYDVIHGLKFRISPLAFFQVNTTAAGVLYNEAIELAAPKPHSTVLDICCGTGTIGLCFARRCKQVIGVEIVPDAVKDAQFNAQENNIENCKFHSGNADDYIQSMIREVVYGTPNKSELDLVAIVDPPRDGLHDRSICSIRKETELKRLVYLSCNPRRAERNWLALGRPESKAYKGSPFLPTKAVAVDMFPHTDHTELIILFERVEDEKAEGSSSDVTTDPTEQKNSDKMEESSDKDETAANNSG
ncbi:unnamed protein product [Hermetia illucens]|uniref:tRNA (uracil(54)-C(5))-methyltransferase n=1 Tax=Hermetia illucens TaxID=343691 RepID=A0A7R8UGD8_HERIL|nr:tRNA (uracil-5-)-methyltransferase homolog A [Hermetia illucens]CAD7080390.1 unnamed protein product [Hermetia illucens]